MSDQDFFFDEDEKPAKTTGSSGSKQTASSAPKGSAAAASAAPVSAQPVSMTIAILIGVIGILLGAVIGLFIGRSLAAPSALNTPTTVAPTESAPQLTPEQLQGGELPQGHPNIGGGAGTPTATPAP